MPNTFDRGYAKLRRKQVGEAVDQAVSDIFRGLYSPNPLLVAAAAFSRTHHAAVARGDRLEALIRGHQEGRRAAAGATKFRSFDATTATIVRRWEWSPEVQVIRQRTADDWTRIFAEDAARGWQEGLHAELIDYGVITPEDLASRPRTFTLTPIDDTIGVDEAAAMAWDWGEKSPIVRLPSPAERLEAHIDDELRRHPLDGITDPYGA